MAISAAQHPAWQIVIIRFERRHRGIARLDPRQGDRRLPPLLGNALPPRPARSPPLEAPGQRWQVRRLALLARTAAPRSSGRGYRGHPLPSQHTPAAELRTLAEATHRNRTVEPATNSQITPSRSVALLSHGARRRNIGMGRLVKGSSCPCVIILRIIDMVSAGDVVPARCANSPTTNGD